MKGSKKTIYLDYNATTPVDPQALDEMERCLRGDFGNPSSAHSYGLSAKFLLDEARQRVADMIGAEPDEIAFTSGGTESNNMAVIGAAMKRRAEGTRIVTSAVEHSSVLNAFRYLETQGFDVVYLNVDGGGLIDIDELRRALTDSTVLVSVMHVNNETGAVMPIGEIAGVVKEGSKALFHTDAVQAVGKVKVDAGEIPVDLMSVSSHKIYGPKGAGALFIKNGVKITPMFHGGGHERGWRSGTENVPGIVGFGKAASILRGNWETEHVKIKALRDYLRSGILKSIPGAKMNISGALSVANTVNVMFEGVEGDAALMSLDLEGIAISTGSACSEGNVEASHVLLAMGLSQKEALSSVRISLGRFTVKEEIDALLDILPRVIERIRSVGQGAQTGTQS